MSESITTKEMIGWVKYLEVFLPTNDKKDKRIIVAIIKTLKEYDQLKQAIKIMGELQDRGKQ